MILVSTYVGYKERSYRQPGTVNNAASAKKGAGYFDSWSLLLPFLNEKEFRRSFTKLRIALINNDLATGEAVL